MSAASSFEEYTLSKTEMAQVTDQRLLYVAENLPMYAFRGAEREPVVICQQLDVGELSCTNTGAQTMELMVKLYGNDDKLGFWKEYKLPTGALGRPRETITLLDGSPTCPSDFDDCPDTTAFMQGFDLLFAKFIDELPDNYQSPAAEQQSDNVVYLADYQTG